MMHIIDYLIFGFYFIGVLLVGFYFYGKNKNKEDYYIGGRKISSTHIGLSIVATDVGGGFSIGLGGLGFLMGLSGSWLLFTGLVGAWLAAVLIVPKIKKIDGKQGMLTFPDFLNFHYGKSVALWAAVISGIGYLGFTSAQIMAGAKLASATIFTDISFMPRFEFSLYLMAVIIVIYTVLGGIKAVIYTDTIQWLVLLGGLLLFGVPFTYVNSGGWAEIRAQLPPEFFTLTNISTFQLINWAFTIIPIWFIAMTLYQRIYSCRDEKEAKRAFFIAGILEYPVIAFLSVFLGMMARIHFPNIEAETAMPTLLKDVLPFGIRGIVIAAYFSAIMSTADSCLLASSGNFVNDILVKKVFKNLDDTEHINFSQIITLVIGIAALMLAQFFQTVLEIILHAYSFMVAGLFVPTLGAFFLPKKNKAAALTSMLLGGGITLILIFTDLLKNTTIEASVYGLCVSAITFFLVYLFFPPKEK